MDKSIELRMSNQSRNTINELTNGSWWIEGGGEGKKRQKWETFLVIMRQPEQLLLNEYDEGI